MNKWYCPNCGPVTEVEFEDGDLYTCCVECAEIVEDEIPLHVIAMREKIAKLEDAIAKLQRVAIQTVFYLSESLEVNDGYELDEALRAAGYEVGK